LLAVLSWPPWRGADGLGIADIGFAWAAWIIDPATSALGILQIKE
jgi:hypothetical protein